MADPLTTTLRLTQPTVGGDDGTWGTLLNSDLSYIDEAINQTVAVSVSDTNFTFTADGSSSDQARYLRYNVTGSWTANRTGTLPANLKVGYVTNNTTGGFNLILTAGGTNLTIPPDGQWYLFQVDGSNNVSQPPIALPQNRGRNLFHNPVFNVQQRGAGPFTGPTVYTADRWELSLAGSDTDSVTIFNLNDTDRAQIGDGRAIYGLQNVFTGSGVGNSYSIIVQKLEGARTLSGKLATISFWAKASSGTPQIGVGWEQIFGTGGSPSSTVMGNIGVTSALSSTWARYSFTWQMPSASGKTFGSAGTDYTQIDFWYSCASGSSFYSESGNLGAQTGTVQFWGMQLEIGPLLTPIEIPDNQQVVAQCQRFYLTITSIGFDGYGAGSGAAASNYIAFPVTMRSTPSATLTGTSVVNCALDGSGFFNGTNVGFKITVQVTSIGSFGWNGNGTFSADL